MEPTACTPMREGCYDRKARIEYLKSYAADIGKPPPADLIVGAFRPFSGTLVERSAFEAAYESAVKAGITWLPVHAEGVTEPNGQITYDTGGGELIAKVSVRT